jgi:hypothetical protein
MNTELIKQIGQTMIDDPVNGYKEWEVKTFQGGWRQVKSWFDLVDNANTHHFRRKQKTVTYTVTIPEPYRGPMKKDQVYFVAYPAVSCWYVYDFWGDDPSDKRYQERGLVYLNKEDAIAAAKAMVGLE